MIPDNISLEEAMALLAEARDEENSAYWRFTRCAKGQPVSPEITRRICALETRISLLRRGDKV